MSAYTPQTLPLVHDERACACVQRRVGIVVARGDLPVLVSAFSIIRASAPVWLWPRISPRLPVEETALNTAAPLAATSFAQRALRRDRTLASRLARGQGPVAPQRALGEEEQHPARQQRGGVERRLLDGKPRLAGRRPAPRSRPGRS